jgi:eukaryotic translation initiation factor 2C
MLKVNLKMGGVNTYLPLDTNDDSEIRRLLSLTTMIVGADVTHPGPGSMEGTNSIAAVVGSIEETFSQYPASVRCQESKMEMLEQLDLMLEERIETWSRFNPTQGKLKRTKALPDQILFFRDGVAENQYQTICDKELPQIDEAIKKTYRKYGIKHPKLLFICIVKRVNTRFFPVENPNIKGPDPNIDPKHDNSWPGLVVDTHITYPRGYDFYMQSQHALQGTAKPAHYVVIVDQIGVHADVLQKAVSFSK